MAPVTPSVMHTHYIKEEVDKSIAKLMTLRDEVKVQLHLASLDAKKEWDEKLAPKVFEVETSAKNITESTRSTAKELIARLEEFLVHLREKAPPSKH
jgi:alcohol dehydrogenase class IV